MTKAKLAQQLLARAFAVGVPAAWVTGDRVYGDDRRLRMWLESCPQAYVLAVSGKEYVWLGWQQRQVNTLLGALPAGSWTGWYRHITLAMWALALLAVLRAGAIAVERLKKSPRSLRAASSLAAFKAQRGLRSP